MKLCCISSIQPYALIQHHALNVSEMELIHLRHKKAIINHLKVNIPTPCESFLASTDREKTRGVFGEAHGGMRRISHSSLFCLCLFCVFTTPLSSHSLSLLSIPGSQRPTPKLGFMCILTVIFQTFWQNGFLGCQWQCNNNANLLKESVLSLQSFSFSF